MAAERASVENCLVVVEVLVSFQEVLPQAVVVELVAAERILSDGLGRINRPANCGHLDHGSVQTITLHRGGLGREAKFRLTFFLEYFVRYLSQLCAFLGALAALCSDDALADRHLLLADGASCSLNRLMGLQQLLIMAIELLLSIKSLRLLFLDTDEVDFDLILTLVAHRDERALIDVFVTLVGVVMRDGEVELRLVQSVVVLWSLKLW